MKCVIHDCNRVGVCKFLCSNHYQKLRQHGTTYGASKKPKQDQVRPQLTKVSETYSTSESLRTEILLARKESRLKNKFFWVNKLGGMCVDCGTKDIRVLTFDHQNPSSKSRNISSLIACSNPENKNLAAEMAKCVLRCANCHLIKSVECGEIGRKRKYV